MNEKEAKEILEISERHRLTGEYVSYGDFFQAKGYLEGLKEREGEIGELLKGLRDIRHKCGGGYPYEEIYQISVEVLAQHAKREQK